MVLRLLLMTQLCFATAAFALTDQSHDLKAVLENGTLSKADCDRYKAGDKSEGTKLRCGKYMFIYDSLGIPGLPAGIVDLMLKQAPNTLGPGMQKWGFIPDPFSKKNLPVGFGEGPKLTWGVPSYTPTCATCHFGRTPDGRYVIGQPNHDLKFSNLVLALGVLSELALQPKKAQAPEVMKILKPLQDEFFGRNWSKLGMLVQTLKLLPEVIAKSKKPMTDAEKIAHAFYHDGTSDLLAAPSVDDGVPQPMRILPLWDLPSYGPMLSAFGGTPDIEHSMRTAFVMGDLLGGDNLLATHTKEDIEPLVAYIKQLKRPINLQKFEADRLDSGRALFDQNCVSCHDGPSYAGTKLYDLEEIGTDAKLALFADKDSTGKAYMGVVEDYELTGKVRAARLASVWSLKRFLHNGTLSSLEEVFCLDGPRPPARAQDVGLDTGGHMYTCDAFSREEKEDLIYFLKSL